eukprot:TRINITY_DN8764_c0_g1_i1.p1 TRINITY_DN8764_c0_g1~~TRINITY_DN8764_c0_g1_i1.p1  ORF type:complete len:331 (+),score=35.08 TRINITY_DN8764_c0_g1_i1:1-993(+)
MEGDWCRLSIHTIRGDGKVWLDGKTSVRFETDTSVASYLDDNEIIFFTDEDTTLRFTITNDQYQVIVALCPVDLGWRYHHQWYSTQFSHQRDVKEVEFLLSFSPCDRPHEYGRRRAKNIRLDFETYFWGWKGNSYQGGWLNDNPQGYGTCRYNNGDIHRGQWEDGRYHGPGEHIHSNGGKTVGTWEHGRLNNNRSEVPQIVSVQIPALSLQAELNKARSSIIHLEEELQKSQLANDRLRGSNLDGLTITELEVMRIQHQQAIEAIKIAKRKQKKTNKQNDTCRVCMEQPLEIIILPCAHYCLCNTCARSRKWSDCPVCRTPIRLIQKVFR